MAKKLAVVRMVNIFFISICPDLISIQVLYREHLLITVGKI